ncbi:MAG TPA: MBL fold metallo-hydrolase [Verrucomicrobiae bacterium]|nr:MBL fold metallo-hydrolase [Verrucomicrobiae bacterium]
MRISFYGAAREVTGSCYVVESSGGTRLLVDCGMFQGTHIAGHKNFDPLPFDASAIEAVFVTHAHLDHTGRLPKLMREGFKGKIYATPPTIKLAQLVLEDTIHIMQDDLEKQGRAMLYEQKDVDAVMAAFVPVEYSHDVMVGDVTARARDAGHIFGSAFWELRNGSGKRVTFSGDIGNRGSKILRPTAQLSACDALVVESTYGNRIHEDESTRETKLKDILKETVAKKGMLVIPAFAIDRTQQILFELNDLANSGMLPDVPIFLDSPMAIRATEVLKEFPQYYNKETQALAAQGDDPFSFPGLKETLTRDQSKEINDVPNPKVVIAGSGMMNGGRILHHLLRALPDPNSTVLIVGYQSEGTLGRDLYEGKKDVVVRGVKLHVNARITGIGAYSAHADQAKLIDWVKNAEAHPKEIFVTHGEEGSAVALATLFQSELGIKAIAPHEGDSVDV